MFTEERQAQILSIVNDKKSVSVHELSQTLFVSDATIRRDLTAMEKAGLIKRSHGGAVLFESTNDESSILIREQENIREKKMIAELAMEFVRSNYTIFMDSSSTTGTVIPLLKQYKYLSVVTNGLKNAILLSQRTNAKIYMTSGVINNQSNSIVGSDTIAYLNRLHADLVLFSCSGITLESGITDASFEQSNLKQVMIKNSKIKVLLCDSSKFDNTYLCRTCGFEDIDYIITNKRPDQAYLRAAEAAECTIIYPHDEPEELLEDQGEQTTFQSLAELAEMLKDTPDDLADTEESDFEEEDTEV
ncbi:MAG: DeoR/GlpR family DNA-binding transcription regulator [Massiliimalia sp.]|jgi:DeoR/GlpR family transcriptional regulator of sugar metabolism